MTWCSPSALTGRVVLGGRNWKLDWLLPCEGRLEAMNWLPVGRGCTEESGRAASGCWDEDMADQTAVIVGKRLHIHANLSYRISLRAQNDWSELGRRCPVNENWSSWAVDHI